MVEVKSEKPTVAVIGSGFSGICTFIELQNKLGIIPQLFETNKDLGGTWMANTYPGCSCDIPSHVYSLRSDLNPDWSSTYSPQPEILEYMKNVARKYNIYAHIQFETEVIRAVWITERRQWRIDLRTVSEKGYTESSVHYDILFSGAGLLRIPHIPPEFKAFKGQLVHTSQWDSSIDYKGKRIALVGSGSSAIQSVPFLVKNASQLISYQRSVAHVYPRHVVAYSEFMKWMFRYIPFCLLLYRLYLYFMTEFNYLFFGYPDAWITKRLKDKNQRNIEATLTKLGRSDLIPVLKPSYEFGCKRLIFSSDYFEAIASPNVTVVRSPIKEIKGNKIITEDGQIEEVDILVLGTGYKTQEGFLGDIEILGDKGQSLTEIWKTQLPQLYKSTMIHGFPNLFFLLGPTTILGHSSVVLVIETQVNFAVKCIKEMIMKRKMEIIEPTSRAQDRCMARLRKDLKGTVWTNSCNSWYKNEDGVITILYPNTVTRFKWELGKFKEDDFVKYPSV